MALSINQQILQRVDKMSELASPICPKQMKPNAVPFYCPIWAAVEDIVIDSLAASDTPG